MALSEPDGGSDPSADGPPPDAPAPAVTPAERERVVRRLTTHFARDHLELAELERRLDLAYRARTPGELAGLEAGLPELEGDDVPEVDPGPLYEPGRETDDLAIVPAVMGGVGRKLGPTAPRRVVAVAFMGGVELDFRETTFAEPVTEVVVVAIMGGVEVLVSPGTRVESRGLALMGGFGDSSTPTRGSPGTPCVRVRGVAIMGGVDVQERYPHESPGEARKRLRAERRRRRRERGR